MDQNRTRTSSRRLGAPSHGDNAIGEPDHRMRIFNIAYKYNNHWNVEAEWFGKRRIVHSGLDLFKVIHWAVQHGYYEE